jgi:predicted O-methyltransferase YrrM
MHGTPDRYDFIFLDGDHRAPAVYAELAAALARLNPGGVILLHDYYPGAVPLFADGNIIAGPFHALRRAIAEQPSLSVLPLGALPWPTKLGSHVTSLALVAHAA